MKTLKNLLSKFHLQKKIDLDSIAEDSLIVIANEYIAAFGGRDNIKNIHSCSTRLRVTLNENNIDDNKLIKSGAKRIIKLDELNYQVVIGQKATKLEEIIKKYLG